MLGAKTYSSIHIGKNRSRLSPLGASLLIEQRQLVCDHYKPIKEITL